MSVLELIKADVEATTHDNFRLMSNRTFWVRVIGKALVSPNVQAVVIFRLAQALAARGRLNVALLLRAWGIRRTGAELHPLAEIGPGLYLAHAVGVGVGAYVTIGSNCRMHLGSVVGPQARDAGPYPPRTVIGDDVFIGTHAVIAAGVTVGDGAVIGANAVVMRDVEPYTIVSASPARAIGRVDQS